jgi:hypothetical protein
MARHDFRFVVDGVDLDEAACALVAAEVQKAGLAALQNVARLTNPLMVGHSNIKLRPEWRGIWVINGTFADQIGQRINDIGFYQ